MMRNSYALTVFMVAWASQPAHCADPSPSSQQPFRFLSLAEARALALTHTKFPAPVIPTPAAAEWSESLSHSVGPWATPSPPPLWKEVVEQPSVLQELLHRSPVWKQIEFERDRCQLLLDVETAYWDLYGSWRTLHNLEQALRLARAICQQTKSRNQPDDVRLAQYNQARCNYEQIRGNRLLTIANIHDNAERLNNLLGLSGVGPQIVPSDAPTLTLVELDWESALATALSRNPSMRLFAWDLLADQLQYAFFPECNTLLARGYERNGFQVMKVARLLGTSNRRRIVTLELMRIRRMQREAFGERLLVREKEYLQGRRHVTLDSLLDGLNSWVDSNVTETLAIRDFRNAVANFAFVSGDFLSHAGYTSGEELTPEVAALAIEREQKRTESEIRRELAMTRHYGQDAPAETKITEDPSAPSALALPALWKAVPPLEEVLPLSKDKSPNLREWQLEKICPTISAKNEG
jgi:Outer membrane efflux protein